MDVGERGAWNLGNVRFLKPGSIQSWAVASTIQKDIALQSGPQGLNRFIIDLIHALDQTGIPTPVSRPPLVNLENKTVDELLREAIQEANNLYNRDPDLILVLLPERKGQSTTCVQHPIVRNLCVESGQGSMYIQVKQTAERDLGIVTQCFVSRSAGIGQYSLRWDLLDRN